MVAGSSGFRSGQFSFFCAGCVIDTPNANAVAVIHIRHALCMAVNQFRTYIT
jgi:hypothetical protein